ncbi:protein PSK SIMULATOR 1 isoform X4 [Lathyrus oleraceus]|uniref:protein PSK SIMULATOR 1 isoform X4 n=1 Tax=Pisum sativum TaxID=3888 RepID=UPI0021D1A67A|nr:protein PSK SIMULATOR 1-like isoform X4 [Pisum sativum]
MGFLKKKKSPAGVNADEVYYDGIPRYVKVDRVFANSDTSLKPFTINNPADITAPPYFPEITETNPAGVTADEVLSDGIPRYADKLSAKQPTVVSEVSSRLGRARPGKVLGFLDSIGSSMTNLSASSKFVSRDAVKGTRISILAFEVANTIIKGYRLMQSLSTQNIRHLKEEVLLSEAVHDLVSKEKDELLRIVAADKWHELKVFSEEVSRFGNRSKDPQWRNLDCYFEKISKESSAQRLSRDEAESIMQELMTSAQFTVVIEKLKDIVHFLHLEIRNNFGSAVCSERCILHARVHVDQKPIIGHIGNRQRLGAAGLALHYANIVLQIDTLVARSLSMLANTRDSLYQNLPPNIKSALRSKLPSYHVIEELTVAEIKYEMKKTLHWLVPIATNTSKAHHCFGWLGEWENTVSEVDTKVFQGSVMRIETFHYAYKDKVEHYILELLLWLHRMAIKSKIGDW